MTLHWSLIFIAFFRPNDTPWIPPVGSPALPPNQHPTQRLLVAATTTVSKWSWESRHSPNIWSNLIWFFNCIYLHGFLDIPCQQYTLRYLEFQLVQSFIRTLDKTWSNPRSCKNQDTGGVKDDGSDSGRSLRSGEKCGDDQAIGNGCQGKDPQTRKWSPELDWQILNSSLSGAKICLWSWVIIAIHIHDIQSYTVSLRSKEKCHPWLGDTERERISNFPGTLAIRKARRGCSGVRSLPQIAAIPPLWPQTDIARPRSIFPMQTCCPSKSSHDKVILPRDISRHPGGIESTATHAHHPHPFTKTSLPLHDHSCNHSIDLAETPSSQAVTLFHVEVLHFWLFYLDSRQFHCAFLPACLSVTSIWYCLDRSCCSQSAEYAREIRRNADLSIRRFSLFTQFCFQALAWDKILGESERRSTLAFTKQFWKWREMAHIRGIHWVYWTWKPSLQLPSHNSCGMSMAKTSKDHPGVGKGTTTCGRPSWSSKCLLCKDGDLGHSNWSNIEASIPWFFPLGLQLLQTTANSLHLQ